MILLRRADLHRVLRDLARAIPIHLGMVLQAVEERGDGVEVTFGDGSRATFDALVGADGQLSQVRALRFGPGGVTYTGATSWLYMAPPVVAFPEEINDLFGQGRYIGAIPDGNDRLCPYFMLQAPARRPDPPERRVQVLRREFADFGWAMPALLTSMDDPGAIYHPDIYGVSLDRWHAGRVALLGNAAHAFVPGFGAAMALEDAWVLAEELRTVGRSGVERALASYVDRRRPRIARVRRSSTFLEEFTIPSRSWRARRCCG